MPTILPPPASPQPLPAASPTSAVATVASPPATLTQMPVGTLLRAEIMQLVARGMIEVQTDFGSVQLRTNLPLAVGAKLELQLLKTAPQVQLAIRAVDGAPPGQTARATPQVSSGPDKPASARPQAALGSMAAPGGPAAAAGTAATPPTLAVGALVRATVLRSASGVTAPAAAPGSTQPPNAAASSPGPPGALAAPSGARAPVPPSSGGSLEVRIVSITPAGRPPASAAGATNTIAGTLTAVGANGRAMIETPIGLISLESVTEAPVGTQIRFAPVSSGARMGSAAPSAPEMFLQNRAWPALEEAVAFLAQRPEGASPGAVPPLPRANGQLAANILAFLTALKGGDIHSWLGSAATVLESERPDLARQLNEEFAQFARTLNDAPPNDWRTAVVPFFGGALLQPVQMHVRGGKSQKDDAGNGEGSRFIIDLELSKLGRVQLDGFVKNRRTGTKQVFDLIIRTRTPLPQRMRRDINRIFVDFSEAAGLTGSLSFQARAAFVDVPLPRLAPSGREGLVV